MILIFPLTFKTMKQTNKEQTKERNNNKKIIKNKKKIVNFVTVKWYAFLFYLFFKKETSKFEILDPKDRSVAVVKADEKAWM